MYPYIVLHEVSIPTYALIITLAAISGAVIAFARMKQIGLTASRIVLTLILSAAGFYIGSKLFSALLHIGAFAADPNGLTFWQYVNNAPTAFLGGLLLAALLLYILARASHISFLRIADALVPSLLLFQSIAKVGCFLGGCCYGIPWAAGFIMDPLSPAPADTHLFPVQLAESAAVFALFLFVLFYARIPRAPGKLLGIYLLGYGVARFALEFLRSNPPSEVFGPFSMAQWICLAFVPFGAYLLLSRRNEKKSFTASVS